MTEWKASITLRIPPTIREELEEVAAREKRSLGNLGSVLLEWATQQLRAVDGSTERLLKTQIKPSADAKRAGR
jgi:hypothetical protein